LRRRRQRFQRGGVGHDVQARDRAFAQSRNTPYGCPALTRVPHETQRHDKPDILQLGTTGPTITRISASAPSACTAAAIDAAVGNAHTHANKSQLDKIGEDAGGGLTYDGQGYVQAGSVAW
jgi:hypothetical protein